jgi:hypothetical protein
MNDYPASQISAMRFNRPRVVGTPYIRQLDTNDLLDIPDPETDIGAIVQAVLLELFDGSFTGPRGYSVLVGTIAPPSGVGADGDIYIRSNGDVYGPKVAGAWGSVIFSILGPQGIPGTNGTNGTNGLPGATGDTGIIRVNYGSTAGTARPATTGIVLWVGSASVLPTNADTSKDLIAQS